MSLAYHCLWTVYDDDAFNLFVVHVEHCYDVKYDVKHDVKSIKTLNINF